MCVVMSCVHRFQVLLIGMIINLCFSFVGLFGSAQPWLCWFVGGFDCVIAFFVLGNARPLFLSPCNTAMTIITRPYQTAGLVNAQAWGDFWLLAAFLCQLHMLHVNI